VEQISELLQLEEDSLNVQVLTVIEIAVKLFDCAENEQDRWDCVAQQLCGGGLWIAHVLPIPRSSKRRAHKDGSSGFTPSFTGLSPALYFCVIACVAQHKGTISLQLIQFERILPISKRKWIPNTPFWIHMDLDIFVVPWKVL